VATSARNVFIGGLGKARHCKSGLESGTITGSAGADGRRSGVFSMKNSFHSDENKRDACTMVPF
jgi:hypothetical protein